MNFSIIVPFYNEREYINVFLSALSREIEHVSDCEVLLVDNGSTDGSRAIADSFPGIQILEEPIQDPYLARNLGIKAASGTYVLFLDADCAPLPGWLEAIRSKLDDQEPDILLGNILYPTPTPPLLAVYRDYYNSKTAWLLQQKLSACYYGHAGNMGMKRAVFDETGLFQGMPEVGDTAIIHDLLALRPEVAILHIPEAEVTHLEVRTFRECLSKLRQCGGYTRDYSGTHGFRALSFLEKIRVVRACSQEYSYRVYQRALLCVSLFLGVLAFEYGRRCKENHSKQLR